jgi:hypothetical protein
MNNEAKNWFDISETNTVSSERSLLVNNDYMNGEVGFNISSVSEIEESSLKDFTAEEAILIFSGCSKKFTKWQSGDTVDCSV